MKENDSTTEGKYTIHLLFQRLIFLEEIIIEIDTLQQKIIQ